MTLPSAKGAEAVAALAVVAATGEETAAAMVAATAVEMGEATVAEAAVVLAPAVRAPVEAATAVEMGEATVAEAAVGGIAAGTNGGNGVASGGGGGADWVGGNYYGAGSRQERARAYSMRAIYFRREQYRSASDCLTAAYTQRLPLDLCR
jgi:hypothetical protein